MKYDIKQYNPCSSALDFYNQFETSEEAWEKCERGDWMLWIAQKIGVNIYKLTTAKYLCANTVKHLMKDQRSIDALESAKLFGQKKTGRNKLNIAAHAAALAAIHAAAAHTLAAVHAADAALAAAYAADYAADAADAAAATNTAAAAKMENQKQTADICRKILTKEVFRIIKEEQK